MISTLKKKSYEWTQVLYFCVGVINVRIEVVYKIYKCRSVNKCHIFVKEVLETNGAPYSGSPASPHDRYDRCNHWQNSSAIAAIIWKHFRNDRNDRWDTASRLYLGDEERSWIHQKSGWSRVQTFKNIRKAYHLVVLEGNLPTNLERENNKLRVGVFDSQPPFWVKVQRLFHAIGDQMETGERSKSLRSLSTFFSDRNDHKWKPGFTSRTSPPSRSLGGQLLIPSRHAHDSSVLHNKNVAGDSWRTGR